MCGTDKSNLVSVVILKQETMSKMCMWCPERVLLFFSLLKNAPIELYNATKRSCNGQFVNSSNSELICKSIWNIYIMIYSLQPGFPHHRAAFFQHKFSFRNIARLLCVCRVWYNNYCCCQSFKQFPVVNREWGCRQTYWMRIKAEELNIYPLITRTHSLIYIKNQYCI